MIRLYRAPWSTNVQRVHLALDYKGLLGEVESTWITYENRTPVEEASGQSLVPVIDHDGTVERLPRDPAPPGNVSARPAAVAR